MPAQWQKLHRSVLGKLRRQGWRSPLVAWVDEDQGRQVFHRNIVLEDGPAAIAYQAELARRAPLYGFGFVDRKPVLLEPMHAVNYLAGYLAGSASGKKAGKDLAAAAKRARPNSRVWVVPHTVTAHSFVTRRALRAGRRLWASEHGYCARPTGTAIVDWMAIDADTGEILAVIFTREGGEEDESESSSASASLALGQAAEVIDAT